MKIKNNDKPKVTFGSLTPGDCFRDPVQRTGPVLMKVAGLNNETMAVNLGSGGVFVLKDTLLVIPVDIVGVEQ